MKQGYIIAFLIISIAVGFTMWAFSSSMTPYVNIQAARSLDSVVQVRGKILHNTPDVPKPFYDSEMKAMRFWIEDDKKERIEVIYRGGKPDAFDTAPETAAHGRVRKLADNRVVFESDSLVVKCPSKYDDGKGPYKQKPGNVPAGGNA